MQSKDSPADTPEPESRIFELKRYVFYAVGPQHCLTYAVKVLSTSRGYKRSARLRRLSGTRSACRSRVTFPLCHQVRLRSECPAQSIKCWDRLRRKTPLIHEL